MDNETKEQLNQQIIDALKTVFDPEIPVNIYELGLIYKVDVDDEKNVKIDMTLTTPGCPVAATFPQTVSEAVMGGVDVNDVLVELVWDPPWSMDRMSEAAKLQLGIFN